MLNIHQLNQYYGASHTLRDVDLMLEPARVFCLLGRNGVGKTTLLNTLMGLLPARSGEIRLGDRQIDSLATERRVLEGIAYVPQGRMIFPDLTVAENLRLALAGRRDGSARIPEQIYEFFPVLHDMAQRRGGDLSGGQQQQLAIGRALVIEPTLLLLDEPCEGVQPNIVQMIGDVLQRLKIEQGVTTLLVEQKLPFARTVADDFAIMDRGAIVASGAIIELSESLVAEHLAV
ncbi:MAG: urea ABC transporter ATP-binding subunit UrtE [Congregibacter sp.]